MTAKTTQGAGLAARAHHAGDDGPAPARSEWRGRRRMSSKPKQSAVLRLQRSEDLGVKAARLSALVRRFPGREGSLADPLPCPHDRSMRLAEIATRSATPARANTSAPTSRRPHTSLT
jgi:hypothetical protein